jgi:hypothetical protein
MALDKAALGQRFTCFDCETKFYDLNKPDPVCPSCGVDQRSKPDDTPTKRAPPPLPIAKPEEEESVLEPENTKSQDESEDEDEDEDEEPAMQELGVPEMKIEEQDDD